MLLRYDEKEILIDYIESERYEASKEIVIRMLEMGKFSAEQIANCIPNMTVADVNRIQKELLQSD